MRQTVRSLSRAWKPLLVLTALLAAGLLFPGCQESVPDAPQLTSGPVAPVADDAGAAAKVFGERPLLSELNGQVTGDASIADADIFCDGSTVVTLTLDGTLNIQQNPVDIMLVLDRSGSMGIDGGAPLANLKTAALGFVAHLDEVSDGSLDGSFDGSRVGVVSFNENATLDAGLTGSTAPVQAAISALVASGNTNTAAAFDAAHTELLDCNDLDDPPDCATRPKLIIIVTDGNPTVPLPNPEAAANAAAASARAAGIEIFAIGFGSVNVSNLNNWATDPDNTHVFTPSDPSQLPGVFDALGAQIVTPGGTDIVVDATVSGHFSVSGESADLGTVSLSGNTVHWEIDELGDETVNATYTITHDPDQPGGVEDVHDSITYTDNEGNTVTFPDLTINVHGCAANIDLDPDTAVNELGTPGQTHTVTATVTDDFGDPVSMVDVTFDILSGPNAGQTDSGTTDSAGETTFTYTATQGPAGLGTDTIRGCYDDNTGGCDTVTKDWVDTTPPDVHCEPGLNPSGNEPMANNQDGFFFLFADDAVDPDPQIYVDAGDGYIFGPFPSGVNIHYTQAPGVTPSIRPGPGRVDWRIRGTGDLTFYGVDASGNQSASVTCYVPPPPQ